MTALPPPDEPRVDRAAPTPLALFLAFNGLALRGFGGVLPWAQRVLVDETRWLRPDEFVALLSLAQLLPGPNVCNLALMVGDRFAGARGAFAAFGGMLAAPLAIVLALGVLYAGVADHPMVARALRGMGAVSAGLIVAMALKLLPGLRGNRAGLAFVVATFAAIGLLHWPLAWVMLALGVVSVLVAHRRGAR